jgi:ubiquinone/menaquinone biosynthesis C-methylase UbiE
MLQRILEPEVMDSAAEAHDYDTMDHSFVNQLFVTDLLQLWDGNGKVLDVGTGTAQIPIELCRRQLQARVTAIDMAEHMLRVGRRNVESAGLAQRIELQHCDAKKTPLPDHAFDAVMSNSIVHHIPEPFAVLKEMARVVKPGGVLFVRDLLRPADDETLRRLVHTYAGDANAHQQKMFAESLHAAGVCQSSDRHWTWAARANQ